MTNTRLALLGLLAACAAPTPGNIDLARWKSADREPGQWLALGRTFRGDRFSPLKQITAENVKSLGFAWEHQARSHRGRVEHGQEATPIVVDGVLYVAGQWGSVFAVDAKTGVPLWRYDPEVDGSYNQRGCCGAVNRGLQVWRGRIYVATLDGFLVSVDAATGTLLWRVDTFIDRDSRSYTITGPPQIAKNVVVIGNSGADYGVRGYITAYDLETGQQRWRFYTVPGDPSKGPAESAAMERALKTWGPNTDWNSGLGGTVWGEMNYDPELDLLYVGTGNSAPYAGWYRDPSRGDNLYLVSILAIDPDTGELKWHYQEVPWELWDYTATANMILADLTINGRLRKVIMHAPKDGYYYVLDRATGEFISASPFVFVNWATGIDSTGRPLLNPAAVYEKGPAVVFPTAMGGHNWQPMAFNPSTGLTYIPAREEGMVIYTQPEYQWTKGEFNSGTGAALGFALEMSSPADRKLFAEVVKSRPDLPSPDTKEALIAYDPVAQRERWRVQLGGADYAGGGVLTTAGNLVIQGNAAGYLVAYRADTGEKLAEIEVGTGIMAAPVSYQVDGEQYVAVVAGFGGVVKRVYPKGIAAYHYENYGRILAFKLGGGKTPLPPLRQPVIVQEPPAMVGYSDALADRGAQLYSSKCQVCHAGRGETKLSGYPDLHRLPRETHAVFDSIVLGGKLSANGMASFAAVLKPEDVKAIHAYLIREQKQLWLEQTRP